MGLTGVVVDATLRMLRGRDRHHAWSTPSGPRTSTTASPRMAGARRRLPLLGGMDRLPGPGAPHGPGRARLVPTTPAARTCPVARRAEALHFDPLVRAARAGHRHRRGCSTAVTVAAFNELWFRKAPRRRARAAPVASPTYFHPLDGVGDWNRIYGPRGFVQYQFVVPFGAEDALRAVVGAPERAAHGLVPGRAEALRARRSRARCRSRSRGGRWRSTSPSGRLRLGPLLDELDEIVAGAGGRVYLAKDSRLRPELLEAMYPRLSQWRAVAGSGRPRRRARLGPVPALWASCRRPRPRRRVRGPSADPDEKPRPRPRQPRDRDPGPATRATDERGPMNDAMGMPQTAVVVGGTSDIARAVLARPGGAPPAAHRARSAATRPASRAAANELQALGRDRGRHRDPRRHRRGRRSPPWSATPRPGWARWTWSSWPPACSATRPPTRTTPRPWPACSPPTPRARPRSWPPSPAVLRNQGHGRLVVLSSVAGRARAAGQLPLRGVQGRARRLRPGYGRVPAGLGRVAHDRPPRLGGHPHDRRDASRAPFATTADAVAADVVAGMERGAPRWCGRRRRCGSCSPSCACCPARCGAGSRAEPAPSGPDGDGQARRALMLRRT